MRRRLGIRSRAPRAANPIVRNVMQANRSSGSRIELLMYRALENAGISFRMNTVADSRVKCKVDFVLDDSAVCVFVDGCFWHGCPTHFRVPKTNRMWWSEKVEDNRRRDRRKVVALRRYGWSVVRVWEHEITDATLHRAVARILRCVQRKRMKTPDSIARIRRAEL